MPKPPLVLRLQKLKKGTPALTPALGEVHAECASVCLADRGHGKSVPLHVRRSRAKYALERMDVTEQMRASYADLPRTTELGACGVALLLIQDSTGLIACAAYKGGGFDYWLRSPKQKGNSLVFQNAKRLEVSGILNGSDNEVSARLKQKLQQSTPSDNTKLPAMAVVVEFSRPQAEVGKR